MGTICCTYRRWRMAKSNWQNIRNINYFMTHYQSVQAAEADVNIYVAEMRFFRALEYFNKIQLLGDVPWLEVDLNVDSEELYGPKMKRNQVFQKSSKTWISPSNGCRKRVVKKPTV